MSRQTTLVLGQPCGILYWPEIRYFGRSRPDDDAHESTSLPHRIPRPSSFLLPMSSWEIKRGVLAINCIHKTHLVCVERKAFPSSHFPLFSKLQARWWKIGDLARSRCNLQTDEDAETKRGRREEEAETKGRGTRVRIQEAPPGRRRGREKKKEEERERYPIGLGFDKK